MIQSFRCSVYFALIILLPGVRPTSAEEGQEDHKTVEALIVALGDAEADVRFQAIAELAERGEQAKPAVAALIRAVQDPDGDVQRAAVVALGRLALEPDATIPALVSALTEPPADQKRPLNFYAGAALARFGQPAVPHLIDALNNDNLHVRQGALLGVDGAGPAAKDAVDRLIVILREDDPDTRILVLNAFIEIGPDAKAAVPAVTEFLESDDFHTQYWACRALGAIGPDAQSATDELIQLVTTGVTSVRRNAAMALGNIGPTVGAEAVQALTEALTDRSQFVKQDAVIALGKLKSISTSAAPVIEELLLNSRRFSPRASAARTLWLLRPESERVVVDALLRDLSDNSEPWLAAQYLADIDFSSDPLPRIVPLLQSEHRWAREYAAVTLGNFGARAEKARDALEPLLQDEAEEVRSAAAEALKKIDDVKP
jgi:HEAT repeat protein